jgi:hypothetical protein
MRVAVDSSEVLKGLSKLQQHLMSALGRPVKHIWSFPGGGSGELPTWHREGDCGHLAVAMGTQGEWETRTPILVAREPLTPRMTPIVEVNVPTPNGQPNRAINGCLCVSGQDRFVLCYRGNGFTVTPGKVPKEDVHRYFAKWLEVAEDGGQEMPLIPVGPVDTGIADQLSAFADAVRTLKETWSRSSGNAQVLRQSQGWREDLRFPKNIEKVMAARRISREYRHGPIQAALRKALLGLLASQYHVVLNQQVDLGILRDSRLHAVFEVKTDLGDQLYAGIGQLLVYRHYFGDPKAKLFLVVPADSREGDELSEVGALLGEIEIALLVRDAQGFRLSDGTPLAKALPREWLARKDEGSA